MAILVLGKGYRWIMLSNSVLVKQETSKIEWFYAAMQPYVHYVPVNENLSDIFKQLEWMKSHDSELQKISMNAQNFAHNNLLPEHIEEQFVLILNEYHKIQRDNKIIPSLPKAKLGERSVLETAQSVVRRITHYVIIWGQDLWSEFFAF